MKRIALVGVVLGCSTAPAPAEAQPILAREAAPAGIDAAGGMLAWSRYDGGSKTYRLVVRVRGRELLPPVAPDWRAFDVDLGTDRAGRPVAVYSRCADVSSPARKCDLYLLRLGTGVERRLVETARPGRSEFLPSISRGRVAFAAAADRRRWVTNPPRLLVQRVGRRRPAYELPGGPRPRGALDAAAMEIELAGDRLAYVWQTVEHGEPARSSAFIASTVDSRLTLVGLRRRRTTVLDHRREAGPEGTELLTPAFSGGWLYYGARGHSSSVRRISLKTGARQRARARDPLIGVLPFGRGVVQEYGADRKPSSGEACSIGATDHMIGNPRLTRFCTIERFPSVRFSAAGR